eukprot:3938223-Rhodomonas_salina.2
MNGHIQTKPLSPHLVKYQPPHHQAHFAPGMWVPALDPTLSEHAFASDVRRSPVMHAISEADQERVEDCESDAWDQEQEEGGRGRGRGRGPGI